MTHLSNEILDAYAEGALSREERARADAHLAVCATCRLAVVSLAQVGDLLRDEPRVAPPADLAATVIATLEPSLAPVPAARPVRWNWPRLALNGLAAALAWILLILLGGQTIVAAYRAGLADIAELFQAQPDLLSRYPTEAFYAIVETLPLLELGLTLVALVAAVWFLYHFVVTLPEWSRA